MLPAVPDDVVLCLAAAIVVADYMDSFFFCKVHRSCDFFPGCCKDPGCYVSNGHRNDY